MTPAIDGQRFIEAIVFAMAASEGQLPDAIREPDSVLLGGWRLTNDPMNRFGMALAQYWNNDLTESAACLRRYIELMRAAREPLLARYVRQGEGGPDIHPALMRAVARLPLRHTGGIEAQSLLAAAREEEARLGD